MVRLGWLFHTAPEIHPRDLHTVLIGWKFVHWSMWHQKWHSTYAYEMTCNKAMFCCLVHIHTLRDIFPSWCLSVLYAAGSCRIGWDAEKCSNSWDKSHELSCKAVCRVLTLKNPSCSSTLVLDSHTSNSGVLPPWTVKCSVIPCASWWGHKGVNLAGELKKFHGALRDFPCWKDMNYRRSARFLCIISICSLCFLLLVLQLFRSTNDKDIIELVVPDSNAGYQGNAISLDAKAGVSVYSIV